MSGQTPGQGFIIIEEAPKLPDLLAPGLRIVFVGTAAGDKSASLKAYYAGPGNQFWPTLHSIGLTPRILTPGEFRLLAEFKIGLTDLVKRRSGADSSLRAEDFDVDGFRTQIRKWAPRAVAFNGKLAAAAFFGRKTRDIEMGRSSELVGATSLWVLPSTSAAARAFWDIAYWRELVLAIP